MQGKEGKARAQYYSADSMARDETNVYNTSLLVTVSLFSINVRLSGYVCLSCADINWFWCPAVAGLFWFHKPNCIMTQFTECSRQFMGIPTPLPLPVRRRRMGFGATA
jgi:hypothetical protein